MILVASAVHLNLVFKRAAFVLLSLFWLSGCAEKVSEPVKLSGLTMGTSYHITLVPDVPSRIDAAALQSRIDNMLVQLNQQMSTYIDDSEISNLNRAGVNEAIPVSDELFDVLLLSTETSWLSNGAFDITVGPLVNLWGFGPSGDIESLPSDELIEETRARTGYQLYNLNLAQKEVVKKELLVFDLSAIAKGYGVDELANLLSSEGYENYMVEIGGELRLSGHNSEGKLWRIAIEQPEAMPGTVYRAIAVSDKAIATSGDYRNYFVKDGKRYSHTIDPRTGRPIAHTLASVTVIADTAAQADALATAVNVMGSELGMQLAERENLAIYMIRHDGEGFVSSHSKAFETYLK